MEVYVKFCCQASFTGSILLLFPLFPFPLVVFFFPTAFLSCSFIIKILQYYYVVWLCLHEVCFSTLCYLSPGLKKYILAFPLSFNDSLLNSCLISVIMYIF